MEEAWYSIRMRAAEGGAHETGGRHISGAERLARREQLETYAAELIQRAFSHSRGESDFVNISIEKLPSSILKIPPLALSTESVQDEAEGREKAGQILKQIGVSDPAIGKGLALLQAAANYRGAILIHGETGERVDDRGIRGVRVSRMDWDHDSYSKWAEEHHHFCSSRIAEAIALASKVSHSPFTLAELCWSDDPDYITGYVASPQIGYKRITHLKKVGNSSGGRIFFVNKDIDLDSYIRYLELEPVWIGKK
ncbi:6-carboxyhexanoate--CoA ligase [Aneurinibacillus tyrosinisolvens]|uniref:6-carboxyhexanoate--CoA ligase n=1 Tax=Aneurinibacillus tyrosinisolvens TaxID=1443435 RepID=UPI0009E4654D|nr:6-carboxyhexanoate--CoA ligase [Aneurinibacillus tyrosinisolvens]